MTSVTAFRARSSSQAAAETPASSSERAPPWLPPDVLVAALSASLDGRDTSSSTQAQAQIALREENLPVPVPRTWRDHNSGEAEPRLSPIMTGAVAGLGMGLVLTLGVFLASGGLEGARNAPESVARPTLATELVSASTLTTERGSRLILPSTASLIQDVLAIAERLIAAGDLPGARELLGRAAADGAPEAMHALAETFDPNVLAAWGIREAVADLEVARRLYTGALAGGVERSRPRIEALE